jgi:hypothetical protein
MAANLAEVCPAAQPLAASPVAPVVGKVEARAEDGMFCVVFVVLGGLSLHDCICVQTQDRYVPTAAQLPVLFSYA